MAVEKKFKILIYPGLHTRPGAKFVELCNKFESDIEIFFDDKVANGKSIINIMTMAAPQNGEITIKVNGCLLYTSPSPRDTDKSRMPSSA